MIHLHTFTFWLCYIFAAGSVFPSRACKNVNVGRVYRSSGIISDNLLMIVDINPCGLWPVCHPICWSRHARPGAASLPPAGRAPPQAAAEKLYRRRHWSPPAVPAAADAALLLACWTWFSQPYRCHRPRLLPNILFETRCRFRVPPTRDDPKMSGEKDELVQKAKLAEQAERWVEMINEKMLFLVDAHCSC